MARGHSVSITTKTGEWVEKGTQEGVTIRKVPYSYTYLPQSGWLTEYFLDLTSDQL